MFKSLYRSGLTPAKLTAILTKIKDLTDEKTSRLVVKRGRNTFKGHEVVDLEIAPTSATDTVIFDGGSFYGTVAAAKIIQDLTYTAKKVNGWFANDATITYADGGTAGAETVTVDKRAITVHMEDGVSTATQIKAAVEANAEAAALVAITVSGTGSNMQDAQVLTALDGGSSIQYYDKADIATIKRLRTKKYAIILFGDADPTT